MCTVTYFPQKSGDFIFTSNRDETPLRKTIPPKKYIENEVELIYPKDSEAGGTWIGLSDRNRLICLLNGGFENHKRKLPYRHSRGLVVKDCLKTEDLLSHIQEVDLINIEPFTLIGVDWGAGYFAIELVWDGKEKHIKKLDEKPKIWSSSTLYNSPQKGLRAQWFSDFLKNGSNKEPENILRFHQNEKLGAKGEALKMDRLFVKTVSTTRIVKVGDSIALDYFDYLSNKTSTMQMKLE